MSMNLSRRATNTVEVRFEIDGDSDDLTILDAYNQATGTSRKDVMLMLLRDWAAGKRHEARLIVNATRGTPGVSESNRKG